MSNSPTAPAKPPTTIPAAAVGTAATPEERVVEAVALAAAWLVKLPNTLVAPPNSLVNAPTWLLKASRRLLGKSLGRPDAKAELKAASSDVGMAPSREVRIAGSVGKAESKSVGIAVGMAPIPELMTSPRSEGRATPAEPKTDVAAPKADVASPRSD